MLFVLISLLVVSEGKKERKKAGYLIYYLVNRPCG